MPYPQEQLQKLYKNLPRELQDAVFSEETAEVISNACEQYGIDDERVSQVAKYVGDVLMGFILPSEFEVALQKNVDLPEVLVKPIASEINRFVFFPVKKQLEQIHIRPGEQAGEKAEIGIPTPRHSEPRPQQETPQETDEYMAEDEEETSEKSQKPKEVFSEEQRKQDPYREKAE